MKHGNGKANLSQSTERTAEPRPPYPAGMWRWKVPRGREIEWAKQRVCLFLKRQGFRYPTKEVCVVVQGERILVAFNWDQGKPGRVAFRK